MFAVEAPEADAIKDACAVLAAAAGTTSKSVLLALRNANFVKGGSSTTNTVRSDSATMSVNGRPWTRQCSVHGCSGIHPFYMHAQITGQPVDAVSQAKMDAFAARKNDGGGKAGASKKPKANRVLAATATTDGDDDDDDDDVEQYFICWEYDLSYRIYFIKISKLYVIDYRNCVIHIRAEHIVANAISSWPYISNHWLSNRRRP